MSVLSRIPVRLKHCRYKPASALLSHVLHQNKGLEGSIRMDHADQRHIWDACDMMDANACDLASTYLQITVRRKKTCFGCWTHGMSLNLWDLGLFEHLTLCATLIWLLISIALHLQNVGLLLPSNLGAKVALASSHPPWVNGPDTQNNIRQRC